MNPVAMTFGGPIKYKLDDNWFKIDKFKIIL